MRPCDGSGTGSFRDGGRLTPDGDEGAPGAPRHHHGPGAPAKEPGRDGWGDAGDGPAAGGAQAGSDPLGVPAPAPVPGLWLPWQRFVAWFVLRNRAGQPGSYRPLCLTRGCFYNRAGTCTFDRVEPAPAAVMEAAQCPHALFLQRERPDR